MVALVVVVMFVSLLLFDLFVVICFIVVVVVVVMFDSLVMFDLFDPFGVSGFIVVAVVMFLSDDIILVVELVVSGSAVDVVLFGGEIMSDVFVVFVVFVVIFVFISEDSVVVWNVVRDNVVLLIGE